MIGIFTLAIVDVRYLQAEMMCLLSLVVSK